MSPGRLTLAVVALLALAGCLTTPPERAPRPTPPGRPPLRAYQPPSTQQPEPRPYALEPLAQLPGWQAEDHTAAFAVVRRGCAEAPRAGAMPWCNQATAMPAPSDTEARMFLETHFRAEPIDGEGVLTAYFSPLYEARQVPDDEFSAPVRPRPPTPINDDRAAIDAAPAPDALAWMRPEDLFFLQIQGSGLLDFPDGRRARAVFAAANGRPFVAVANPMVAQGLIPAAQASAAGVHEWLAAHRGPDAEAVMRLDERYIFFRLVPDDGGQATGAAGVPLTPGRSVAVDPSQHPYFDLLWLDARSPILSGARPSYQRLVAALDTGSAIKGAVRADLYLGQGAAAGAEAAAVRHSLRLYRIVPVGP